jgi:hypothetical protein
MRLDPDGKACRRHPNAAADLDSAMLPSPSVLFSAALVTNEKRHGYETHLQRLCSRSQFYRESRAVSHRP